MTPSSPPPPGHDPLPRDEQQRRQAASRTGTKLVVGLGLACVLGLSWLVVQHGHAPREMAGNTAGNAAVNAAGSAAVADASPQPPAPLLRANFAGIDSAPDVHLLADWVAGSGDAQGKPYAIVDKRRARLYLFDGQSVLQAASPVLLGAARGDDSVPGIGERPIAQVRFHERTTPAGRFPAEPGRNTGGEDIIWVDYDAAVSMHRVRANNAAERRLQRLASATSDDNRISYGCINVPAAFYDAHVKPLLTRKGAMIYVMPEVRSMAEVFGADEVAMRAGVPAAHNAATLARAASRQGA
jgi:hypothetical protein